jgi:hypothetical protein
LPCPSRRRDYRGCLTARSRLEHPDCISFAKNRPSIKHLSRIGKEERGIGMINGLTSKSASPQSLEHLQPSSTIVPFTAIDGSSSLMQSPASRRIANLIVDWIGTRGKNQASKRRTISSGSVHLHSLIADSKPARPATAANKRSRIDAMLRDWAFASSEESQSSENRMLHAEVE